MHPTLASKSLSSLACAWGHAELEGHHEGGQLAGKLRSFNKLVQPRCWNGPATGRRQKTNKNPAQGTLAPKQGACQRCVMERIICKDEPYNGRYCERRLIALDLLARGFSASREPPYDLCVALKRTLVCEGAKFCCSPTGAVSGSHSREGVAALSFSQ